MLHNKRHEPLLRPYLQPKPERLGKRRRVTLIAAFRCYEGVVLCADQQETVGGVRVAVNKLKPESAGAYQLAIAGSGNGDLIDGFAYRLKLDIEGWREDLDERAVYGNLQTLTQDYHENEIANYPSDSADDKLNHFLVCIKPRNRSDIFLWELRGTAIVPVGNYTLLGVSASIYAHELKRLHNAGMNGLQAVLLGVHLFTLAKETSNYVGGSTDVIFVRDNGMTPEAPEDVKLLEDRLRAFNQRIAQLVLLCPDTSQQDVEISGFLDNFREEVMAMRQEMTGQTARGSIARALGDPNWPGDAYPKLPLGSTHTLRMPKTEADELRDKLKDRRYDVAGPFIESDEEDKE